MTIAERIQTLRKTKGLSQEELAGIAGVSRQAVSKWESGQSTPDIENILTLSTYFKVSTDYLLKGETTSPLPTAQPSTRPTVCCGVATVLNFAGLLLAWTLWHQYQQFIDIAIGLILMAIGCLVFSLGLMHAAPDAKRRAVRIFGMVNVWILSFLPLALCYNLLIAHMPAPYPLLVSPLALFPFFWIVYLALCLGVTLILRKRK